MKTISFNSPDVNILKSYDQNHGTDISNMLEMMEDQLSVMYDKIDKLPENEQDSIRKQAYYLSTLHRQIKSRINPELFLAIDNLLFEIEEQQAS